MMATQEVVEDALRQWYVQEELQAHSRCLHPFPVEFRTIVWLQAKLVLRCYGAQCLCIAL